MDDRSQATQEADKGKKDNLTPLMQQYHDIKSRHRDMIVFFRLGDFYEMFGDDAKKAAPLLEVTLTRRQAYPMCGVPYHAVNSYVRKLIKAGEKVAICEQLEEPKKGASIVKRDVVRVITPGTVTEENLLDSKQNNYLLSICPDERFGSFALAYIDISTGEFQATETDRQKLVQEVYRISPCEIIVPEAAEHNNVFLELQKKTGIAVNTVEDWLYTEFEAVSKIKSFFKVQSLKPFDIDTKPLAARACGGVLSYLEKTQSSLYKQEKGQISGIRYYSIESFMQLDENAVRNLDIIESQNTRTKENSLLDMMDHTLTPMGGRMLRSWILRPLISVSAITKRQKTVEFFISEGLRRKEIRDILRGVSDIERICARIASMSVSPREIIGLKHTLSILPEISSLLNQVQGVIDRESYIPEILSGIQPPQELIDLIETSITEEPPVTLKDGGVIKKGFNSDLDNLRQIRADAKGFILSMENEEKKKTGISTLKIGYTSVFGYYIELTRSNLKNVPQNYIRKQTLTNCERFITPELKAFEEKVLSAEEKIIKLEEMLYKEILSKILAFTESLKNIASAIARTDIFTSFAETAAAYSYCRPVVDNSFDLFIKDGRHPVIERKLKSGTFVPNDLSLNSDTEQIILLTGPNMAGKSTYLRQAALLCIMAQTGSFIPAQEAKIGIIDRIFTRIGASDNLAQGESTFMVEMTETANILNQFTSKSLIILDEVGRGTSTYDGISIAGATLEYLASRTTKDEKKPKVLFATHYFELTDFSEKYPWMKNFNVSVKEWNDEVVFLHKIVPGSADRSYGIHVAQLAGIPAHVIKRAKAILHQLETQHQPVASEKQMNFLDDLSGADKDEFVTVKKIMVELQKLDADSLTPLEALRLIAAWKKNI